LNVTFLGSLTAEQVRAELHLARVLCLPSITAVNGDAEGFGMVILEAQACGVPVVSSARGGASEGIINGISGFSFPEGDVGILTERLRTLLTDDELAQEMSSRGIRFVSERFDIRKCTQELESYYDSIMESGAFSP
jgi:glycosyltransferase involved in cell wall biosynthesis